MLHHTRVDQLPVGKPAIITAIDREACDTATWRRLHEMGFDEGVDVEVLHKAPLGDPIALRVGNMTIAIRRAQASLIVADASGRGEAGLHEPLLREAAE